MSDILTRLLLNTSDYDSKLKKAKASAQDYGKGLGDVANRVMSGFTKMAGAVGVAMGGMEAFNKVLSSSQTAGDKYAETIAGLKGSIEEFFTALGTGDFSSFHTGIDGIISKAREAYRALDQLGNAQMSFDIAQALAQQKIQEGQLYAKNKFAPVEVATEGFATWKEGIDEMSVRVNQLADDTQNYITKAVESVAGVKGFTANMDNITKGLLLDIQDSDKRKQLKERYADEYQEYTEAIKEASKLLRTGGKTEAQRMHDTREYNRIVAELGEKYNEAITVNALLVKYGDDELKAIGGNVKSMIGLESSLGNLKREFNETAYEFNNRNKALNGFKAIESYEGYKVYQAQVADKPSGSAKGGSTKKNSVPVSVATVQYETPLGQKVLKWMNGEEKPIIKANIEIEDEVDEEDLSGKWGEHVKEVEKMNEALSSTASIFGSLGSIAGQAGNDFLAATLTSMGSVAQMIMELQALCTAQGVTSASKLPFPANLAAIATVVATIASVFSSLPKFAEGGIVGGSSYFGDKLLARVNSGEMILNQGQQARLLNMTDGGNVRVSGDVRLNGKDIFISLRNYMASSGNKL